MERNVHAVSTVMPTVTLSQPKQADFRAPRIDENARVFHHLLAQNRCCDSYACDAVTPQSKKHLHCETLSPTKQMLFYA